MWGKREWLIFCVALLVFALLTKTQVVSPNDSSRIAAIQSIVEHGTFAIDQSPFSATMDRVRINEHFYSDKPAMTYLIAVPVYFVLFKLGYGLSTHHNIVYYFIVLMTLGVSVSAMLVCFFRLLKRYGLSDKEIYAYTAALGLGTLILPYTLALNNHSLAAAFLLMSYYFLVTAKTPGQYAFAGLMAGLTATFEIAGGPIFLGFFTLFLFLKKRWRTTAWYVAGAAVPMISYLAINYAISGSVIPFSIRADFFTYPGGPFSGGAGLSGLAKPTLPQIAHYVWHILFGAKGLFSYTPMLLFSFAGLLFAAFTRNKFRHEALTVLFAALATFIFYATKTNNFGGCNYGFRFILHLVPILFVFTPVIFQQPRAPNALKLLFFIAFVYSLLIALTGVIQHPWTCDPRMWPGYALKEMAVKLYESLSFHTLF